MHTHRAVVKINSYVLILTIAEHCMSCCVFEVVLCIIDTTLACHSNCTIVNLRVKGMGEILWVTCMRTAH